MEHHITMRIAPLFAAAVAATLTLSACSGGDSDSEASDTGTVGATATSDSGSGSGAADSADGIDNTVAPSDTEMPSDPGPVTGQIECVVTDGSWTLRGPLTNNTDMPEEITLTANVMASADSSTVVKQESVTEVVQPGETVQVTKENFTEQTSETEVCLPNLERSPVP